MGKAWSGSPVVPVRENTASLNCDSPFAYTESLRRMRSLMPIHEMKWQGCLQEEILACELCAVIEQVFAKSKKKAVATGMGFSNRQKKTLAPRGFYLF
jgi:hypothetical protein